MEEAGREQEAIAVLEQAVELDPLNALINGQLAIQWARRGRYGEAIALLDRFERLPEVPDIIWAQIFRVNQMRSRMDLFWQSVVEMLEHDGYPDRVRRGGGNAIWVFGFGRDLVDFGLTEVSESLVTRLPFPRALKYPELTEDERDRKLYEQASGMTDKEILDQGLFASQPMVEVLRQHGEYERAIRLLAALANEHLFASARTWVPEGKVWLATLYLEAGRDAEAAIVLEGLSQLLEPMVAAGMRNAVTLEQLAQTQALQGHVDAAISALELSEASGNGTVFNCYHPEAFSKVLDPFAALRSDPRFQRLHDRCMAEWERQRAAIRALFAERDFDVLLGPLMARAEEEKAKKRAAAAGK
jgi:tetratricopeptide (TPR) repeat protein